MWLEWCVFHKVLPLFFFFWTDMMQRDGDWKWRVFRCVTMSHPSVSSSSSSSAQSFGDRHHLAWCSTMDDGPLLRCPPACVPNPDSTRRTVSSRTLTVGDFTRVQTSLLPSHQKRMWDCWAGLGSHIFPPLNSPPHLYTDTGNRKYLLDTISLLSTMTAGCPWASAVKTMSD